MIWSTFSVSRATAVGSYALFGKTLTNTFDEGRLHARKQWSLFITGEVLRAVWTAGFPVPVSYVWWESPPSPTTMATTLME